MNKSVLAVSAVAMFAGSAFAQIAGINGFNYNEFNGFNHFPGSVRTWSSTGTSAVGLHETIGNTEVGPFANRHFAFVSTDGGANPYAYDGVSSFSVQYTVQFAHGTTPVLPTGTNTSEAGLWFLQGGPANSFDDGGTWVITNGTSFTGGMGAGFSLLAEGNGSNPSFPPLSGSGPYVMRFDYWAPGALGPGSLASYQSSLMDMGNGNFRISPLTAWDQGSSWPTGLQAGTAIGFRFQNIPVVGLDNSFDTQYTNIVFGAPVPTPGAAALFGIAGLAGLRRRR